MFKATTAIYNALSKDEKFKVFTEEREKSSEVWLQFGLKNGGSYRIKFISTSDKNDVAVRVFGLTSVDDEAHLLPIQKAVNELNVKYRFVKFCIDEDGDINVEYDFPTSCSDPAESAREIVIRFVQIIEEAYPVLMRVLWQ